MTRLRWSRPTWTRDGETVYTSRCGRYTVERRTWIMPYAHTTYRVNGKSEYDCDTLKEAKELAEMLAEEEK